MFNRFYVDHETDDNLEYCYCVETSSALSVADIDILKSVLSKNIRLDSKLGPVLRNNNIQSRRNTSNIKLKSNDDDSNNVIIERGPKLRYQSEWGTNAKSILNKCGLTNMNRIERFVRGYKNNKDLLVNFDKMVEEIYEVPVMSFEKPNQVKNPLSFEKIPCDTHSLKRYNTSESLGFSEEDLEYYVGMWKKQCRTYVTDIELFDLAQSNSEHSRHHIFRGDMVYPDGKTYSLMDLVKTPLKALDKKSDNSVVAFSDNSSAIKNYPQKHLIRDDPTKSCSKYTLVDVNVNTLLTAETHNFPTGIAPFPGAATGTGGRIRDSQAIGKGGMFIAGSCGYCVGPLGLSSLSDIEKPLDRDELLWSGSEILVNASNGASDYGNKIGEPVIQGFTRSFGMDIRGSRKEWVKPIMFTSGIGMVYTEHLKKDEPEQGMCVVRVGGPAYRIGVGGGTASSTTQTSSMISKLESSVQRGDPEMEQKLDRFVRACVELGPRNPIVSIHDQGAGGMANVTKEIVSGNNGKTGAIIDIRSVYCGDDTMSLKEIWTAEYQEQNTILVKHCNLGVVKKIAQREGVPLRVVGFVTDDTNFSVHDRLQNFKEMVPVSFDLSALNDLPRKTYDIPKIPDYVSSIYGNGLLQCPKEPVINILHKILRHPAVCSKRFLTNKVDRSVTGLIAQQQCVGPLHTPLADVAVVAHSYFGLEGAATAIGEKPIIGLCNPSAMGRMCIGEMLTNMVWVHNDGLNKIKCSGNWMWPAKESVEKSKMVSTAKAMSDLMLELELSIDGGKDSLSMSSTTMKTNTKVDAPPQLVLTGYVSVKDITKLVTPDLKSSGNSLLYLNIFGKHRIGGSVFTQVLNAISGLSGFVENDYPDVDSSRQLINFYNAVQHCIDRDWIVSGHDVSDGGVLVTIMEMAFAGDKGVFINLNNNTSSIFESHSFSEIYPYSNFVKTNTSANSSSSASTGTSASASDINRKKMFSKLFSEELGAVVEVPTKMRHKIEKIFKETGIQVEYIGYVSDDDMISIDYDDHSIVCERMTVLRDIWESTSFELEKKQCNNACVELERKHYMNRRKYYHNNNDYGYKMKDVVWRDLHYPINKDIHNRPRVAMIREEGSNGDREMCAAFYSVGFDVYDIHMNDMLNVDNAVTLDKFNGIVFVGGFSYSDVFGAAKGWEAVIRNNEHINKQFDWYYNSQDSRFSLGVCNGCQLMCRMNWLNEKIDNSYYFRYNEQQKDLLHYPIQNVSQRFESRFVKVRILSSTNNIFLEGMGGCVLGVWVSHGEGNFVNTGFLNTPILYGSDDNATYPENPNGSKYNVAALSDRKGLHLAMMPHPERSVKSWQNPWIPPSWKSNIDNTHDGVTMPWTKLFMNAYRFAKNNNI